LKKLNLIKTSCLCYESLKLNISINDAWDEIGCSTAGRPNLLNLEDGEILTYNYTANHFNNTGIGFVKSLYDSYLALCSPSVINNFSIVYKSRQFSIP